MSLALYISTADVSRLKGCSQAQASRLLNQVRDAMGKRRRKPVTISEYCNYFDVQKEEVVEFLETAV